MCKMSRIILIHIQINLIRLFMAQLCFTLEADFKILINVVFCVQKYLNDVLYSCKLQ